MAKADPETWKMIKGVRLDNMFSEVTQHDFDVITKCTAITTLHLFLSGAFKQPWLKLHLWPSLRIVSLTGRIIVNVDQLSPTNLVTLKLDEVMVEDTPRFYQRIGHFHKLCCLELVALEHERAELGSFGERAELGSSGELSSLRRLWLRSYHSQRLPKGFENPVGLQSLKLDDCTNLCQLPKGLEKCSHLKKLDLSGCSMLEKAVDSWHHLTFLQQLSMRDCRSLKFIPEDIGRLSKLKTLDISGCEMLQKLPNSFGGLSSLEFLDMTGCKNLECLCESFCKVSKLKEWRITGCKKLQKLPGNFEGLSSLEMLDMAGCRMLECLCESFSKLSKLKILNINYCEKLQQLPRNFEDFSSLEELYMSNCRMLECLCEGFGKLSKLKKLGICFCEKLQEFPDSFGNLSSLEDLDMRWCTGLKYLCDNFGKLSKLKRLDLRGCQMLQKLPNNFGDLSKLEHLSIDGCEKLEQLPEGFGNLLSLENLYMKSCSSLECLCGNFGKLSKLKQLHMANCGSLKTLTESFANLSTLEKLTLEGCTGLHKLPETMQRMPCLRFLNLKGCKNIQISAEGLPCSLTVIDIRECQCNEFEFTNLLRMQSLFLVVYSPSSRFQECYHYHCLQNNSLPFALPLSGDTSTSSGDKEREIGRSAVGAWVWKGGGSSGFMRMEGDELVWEDAKTSAVTRSGAKIALLMTGLCPYPPEECREALQEAVDEAYKIVWIDCGVWRWNRYVSCSKSEEFRGEVEWDDEDKRRMRKMLQMIPEGCTKRLWTSLFPKNCLVLAFIIVCSLNSSNYAYGTDAMLVKGRCRCRCRGEEETEGQETLLDVEDGRTWKTWEMDEEISMIVREEVERIEIPGFGFRLHTGGFFFDVFSYFTRSTSFFG